MENELTFDTVEEFKIHFQSVGYEYAKLVVNKCFELYDNNEKSIIVSSAFIKEDSYAFIISIEKEDLLDTLQKYLPLFEEEEDYEGCAKIFNLIQKISK